MTVTVSDVGFVRFHAPDLDEMEAFLTDFGMQRAARDATRLCKTPPKIASVDELLASQWDQPTAIRPSDRTH